MKRALLTFGMMFVAATALAQTPIPSAPKQAAFEHDGVNTSGYARFVDGVRFDLGQLTVNSACVGCLATSRVFTIPALSVGVHNLQVVAYTNTTPVTDSTKSNTLVLSVFIVSTPTGLRLISLNELFTPTFLGQPLSKYVG